MSEGRAGKPLYEVMTQERPPAGTSRAEMAELHGEVAPAYASGAKAVRVPMSTVYVAVALVIGLVLLAWVGGHAVGYRSGEAAVARSMTPESMGDLVLREPAPVGTPATGANAGVASGADSGSTVQSVNAGAGDLPGGSSPAVTRGEPVRQPEIGQGPSSTAAPTLGEETGTIISPRGMLTADPRTTGVNYLVLATLNEPSAADAVQFLASKGLETIAVPVSPGSDRYSVVSLGLPVPGADYGRLAPERRAHERVVGQLGRQWLRLERGASDFSQPLWTRYDP